MKITSVNKFRTLHIANHIVALAAIYLAIQSNEWYWFFIGLVCFLWTGIVGVNVALHRYYSHRAFATSKFKERILLWSSVLTSLGSPAMWCSIHRLHHVTSDTDKDPHNPKIMGNVKTWFGIWKPVVIPKRFIVPFLKTKEMLFVHNNYFAISAAILIVLCLIDIRLAGFLYALPAIGCFHGAQAIGVLPHLTGWPQKLMLGYRRHDVKDTSHNNWIASILALGEGWHNNHHANPGRWYQGETWWEIDPPAFMIKHFFMEADEKTS
jgi:stearoyl-CoA desaturase (delta-9 desaturase)